MPTAWQAPSLCAILPPPPLERQLVSFQFHGLTLPSYLGYTPESIKLLRVSL